MFKINYKPPVLEISMDRKYVFSIDEDLTTLSSNLYIIRHICDIVRENLQDELGVTLNLHEIMNENKDASMS